MIYFQQTSQLIQQSAFPYALWALLSGQTGQLLITGSVIGNSGDILNNSVEIYYITGGTTGQETNTGNNADTGWVEIIDTPFYDLALIKQLSGLQSSFVSWESVSFTITVFNQGQVNATNILVSDYVPAGLTLNDGNWTLSGSTAIYNTPIALVTGSSTTIAINFIVNGSVTGSLTNRAEISTDDGTDIDSTPDETDGNDVFSGDDNLSWNGIDDEDDNDPATITVTETLLPDLFVTKTPDGGLYFSGDQVTWVINYGNNGPADVTGAFLDDILPANFTANPAISFPHVLWALLSGQTGQLLITGSVIGNSGDILNNSVEIYYITGGTTGQETNTGNNADTGWVEIIDTPFYDLALIKQLSGLQSSFVSWESVSFTITVFNQGQVNATNILVSDYVPAGLTLNDGNWTLSGSTAIYNTPIALVTGSSQTISINFIVNGSVTGSLTNRAEISTDDGTDIDSTPDETDGNDVFSGDDNLSWNGIDDEDDNDPATITVTETLLPDLFVTKTPDGGLYFSGDQVTWVINYGNNGPADVTGAFLDDILPANFTANPAISFPHVLWALLSGQTGQLLITGSVIGNSGDILNNSVEIYYITGGTTGQETNTGNNADTGWVEIIDTPFYDLALIKQLSGMQSSFVSWESVTFTITVFNQGQVNATNILVSDYVPAGLTLNDGNWTLSGSTAIYNTPIALVTGSSTTIAINFIVNGSVTGSLTNRAEISTDDGTDIDSTPDETDGNDVFSGDDNLSWNGIDDEDDNDPATITITETLLPDLFVTKTPDGGLYFSGDQVTWVINYGNNGPADVTGAFLDDILPANFTANPAISFPHALWALLSGQTGQLLITGSVIGNSGDILNNSVEIYYITGGTTGQETNTGNNADTGWVEIIDTPFYDLALIKQLSGLQSSFVSWESVSFTITVFNQGQVNATNILVSDYVPAGLTLNDGNWTLSGSTAIYNTPIALVTGSSTNNQQSTLSLMVQSRVLSLTEQKSQLTMAQISTLHQMKLMVTMYSLEMII
jgi:uncharacterized repeat protein (TIGR01451 family)